MSGNTTTTEIDGHRLLDVTQAAERLKVTQDMVRKFCQRGLIPGTQKFGPMWLIPEWGLAEFAARPRIKGRPRKDPQDARGETPRRRRGTRAA